MPLKTGGFRRAKPVDPAKPWVDKLEPLFVSDHPRHPDRYDTYVNYVAFLTAGTIEGHWVEGVKTGGRGPFVPLRPDEAFLPDLHKHLRAFRESRHIDGLSSPELVRHSYELLGFLADRVPKDRLEGFLTVARRYVMAHEDECLS
jgi:hypothetical protein